jgi:hypothetical protein
MWEWAATGAIFSRIEERGATATGCTLATMDEEPGKNGPVPKGCNRIRPGFVPGPAREPLHPFGIRFLWPDLSRNAARSYMSIYP